MLPAVVLCSVANAQPAPLSWDDLVVAVDSGMVAPPAHAPVGTHVVFSEIIGSPEAKWVRLEFGEVRLAGSMRAGTHARLRITSLHDGAQQILDARSLRQWNNTSAYFNGSWVQVELLAHRGTGASRVQIERIQAGRDQASGHLGICNGQDDRVPTKAAPDARTFPTGCTAFLIGERCFLSAGHCSINGQSVIHFNLPMSDSDGSLNFAHPDDQYPLDGASIQLQNDNPVCDNDWAYFGVFDNSNTGLSPLEAQGEHYTLADAPPSPAGQQLRIRGYGQTIHGGELPLEWNQVLKIATGPFVDISGTLMFFEVDVSGGDSGSAVFDLDSGTVIGITTCNGCANASVQANRGMAINQSNLQNALANPTGVCAALGACPGEGDCCQPNGTPGCNDAECCELICADDPFCCDAEWDPICADAAYEQCPVTCSECGHPASGSCCEANGTPHCDDAECCEQVCLQDPFCCDVEWDSICVDGALAICDDCGKPPWCGDGIGDCCEPHDTPTCDDPDCCFLICFNDPFCCNTQWDSICADAANEKCHICDQPVPGDLNGDGSVGVADLLILINAWGDCADCGDCPADLNGDCTVGVPDLLILINNWG